MVLSKIFKALADSSRLRVLGALRGKELCACQIIELLRLAPSTVSKHMSVLSAAGLVQSNKRGKWVYYRIAEDGSPMISKVLGGLNELLELEPASGEDNRLLEKILAVDPEQLCRLQSEGKRETSKG